jgi:segregation and condensation protein A
LPPATSGSPAYTVRLAVFEGPLDLLLHLIRSEEMDIYDIPIARITQQYLEYLDTLATLDLDTASEFLVMAAILMDIKSRLLLPRPAAGEFIDEEAQADPRQELMERLLEYRRYKEAASRLAGRADDARRSHSRYGGMGGLSMPGLPTAAGATAGQALTGAVDAGEAAAVPLPALVSALQEVLRELEGGLPDEIARETVTVADKLAEIVPLLAEAGETGLDFTRLLGRARSRRVAVVTFLALLELLRQGRVRLAQTGPFASITVWALGQAAEWRWPGRD